MTDKSNFEKLAEDLEMLAKSQRAEPGVDEKIAAAAADAGVDPDDYNADDAEEGTGAAAAAAGDEAAAAAAGDEAADGDGDDEDKEGEDESLGKSFNVERNGERVKAYDATELLKSIVTRVDAVETASAEEAGLRQHLGKSLEAIHDMLKSQDATIKSQAERLEGLQKSLFEIGGMGVGRKADVTVTGKPGVALAKSQPEGITRADFMAKAESACKAGRISGREVILAETYLNSGAAVPEVIINRVMGNDQ